MEWGGDSPLHLACYQGDLEKVKELVMQGADINALDRQHTALLAPLHIAVIYNHIDIVDYLIKQGAHIDVKSDYQTNLDTQVMDQMTPLHSAVYHDNLSIAKKLLEAGASANHIHYNCYSDGSSPIAYTTLSQVKSDDMKELLLSFGATDKI